MPPFISPFEIFLGSVEIRHADSLRFYVGEERIYENDIEIHEWSGLRG